ncbi:tumor necrosis factor receptor superfamily member 13C [Amia ocellicauda]|uniref:tumor necrosis factor receptor superfamily member 13C n=1 Tax=Amia ocellicauda TaxID=2972642 RepID=UPI0034649667
MTCKQGYKWDDLVNDCIQEAKTNGPGRRLDCLPGEVWENLLNECISKTDAHTTVRGPVLSASGGVLPGGGAAGGAKAWELGPAVWGGAVAVMVGSVLVLCLWCLIYRRHQRQRLRCLSGQTGLRETPTAEEDDTSESCRHVYRASPGTNLQEPCVSGSLAWAEEIEHGAGEELSSVHLCNGRQDHSFPLPATELGGATLVTTKTVQCA